MTADSVPLLLASLSPSEAAFQAYRGFVGPPRVSDYARPGVT